MCEESLSLMAVKRCFVVSVVMLVREQYDDKMLFEETWDREHVSAPWVLPCAVSSCILVSLYGLRFGVP